MSSNKQQEGNLSWLSEDPNDPLLAAVVEATAGFDGQADELGLRRLKKRLTQEGLLESPIQRMQRKWVAPVAVAASVVFCVTVLVESGFYKDQTASFDIGMEYQGEAAYQPSVEAFDMASMPVDEAVAEAPLMQAAPPLMAREAQQIAELRSKAVADATSEAEMGASRRIKERASPLAAEKAAEPILITLLEPLSPQNLAAYLANDSANGESIIVLCQQPQSCVELETLLKNSGWDAGSSIELGRPYQLEWPVDE